MGTLFNLDNASWLKPKKRALLLIGWTLSPEAPPFTSIRLRCGEKIFLGFFGIFRPDVKMVIGRPDSAFCGFSILVLDPPQGGLFLIEACDAVGRWQTVRALCDAEISASPTSHNVSLAIVEANENFANSIASKGPKPVLFISHDFAYAGAQIILLRFMRWLRPRVQFPIEVLINVPRYAAGDASVTEQHVLNGFREIGPVHFISDTTQAPENLPLIRADYYSVIYANTSTLGVLLAAMRPFSSPVISHVYELRFWIERRTGRENFDRQAANTDHFIACSRSVRDCLVSRMKVPANKVEVIYACASMERAEKARAQHSRKTIRRRLKIPSQAFVVEACGTLDWRKGAELFVPICVALRRKLADREFRAIWIGDPGSQLARDQFEYEVETTGLSGVVQLVEPQQNLPWWMLAADCFALPSREDPFPMVMLEAGALGLPVVGFENSGGVVEYAADGAGLLVPYMDIDAFADALAWLASHPADAQRIGIEAKLRVGQRYDHEASFQQSLNSILTLRPCL